MYRAKLFKVFLFLLIFSSFSLLSLTSGVFAATSLTYEYNANGNLIQGDGKYYEYNDANQLVRVRQDDQNGPIIAEYFYDYTRQRIKKIENGVTTYYIGKHYETQVAGDSQINTSYYFANGERVAKKDQSGNVYYYHLDHLGGTNAVTDSAGNLVERTRYYPFGEIRLGGNEKYSFTGKEKDKLTEFYYFESRYYNPEFEHFTQADTVGKNLYDPQDLNRYSYVRNNPLRFVDPTGHSWNPKDWYIWGRDKTKAGLEYTGEKINAGLHYAGEKMEAGLSYAGEKIASGIDFVVGSKPRSDSPSNSGGSWLSENNQSSNYNRNQDKSRFAANKTEMEKNIASHVATKGPEAVVEHNQIMPNAGAAYSLGSKALSAGNFAQKGTDAASRAEARLNYYLEHPEEARSTPAGMSLYVYPELIELTIDGTQVAY